MLTFNKKFEFGVAKKVKLNKAIKMQFKKQYFFASLNARGKPKMLTLNASAYPQGITVHVNVDFESSQC